MLASQPAATSFLSALAAVARHEDFDVEISRLANGHLRVTVEADGHPPLKATGWPAALDVQLPAAIAKYAAAIEREASKDDADQEALIEFPRGMGDIAEERAPAAAPAKRVRAKPAQRRKPAARKATARKRPRSQPSFMKPMHPDAALAAIVGANALTRVEITKKIWGYIRRNKLQDRKNRRQINTDDKMRPIMGGKSQVSMFEMTKLVNKHLGTKPFAAAPRSAPPARPSTSKSGVRHQASKPDKAACIADYKALKAKYGDKLNRPLFVKHAKTKRRYEKLWANSWPDFVKEASGGKETPAASVPAKAAKPAKKADKKAKPAPKADKPAKQEKGPWAVKVEGKQIGSTIFEKKVGDKIAFSTGTYWVHSIDADKRVIQASSAPYKATASSPVAPSAAAKPPAPAAPKPKPPYALRAADGTVHGASQEELAIGAIWGDRWEITAVDHEKREYTVKDRNAATDSAQPATATTEKK